MHLHQAPKPAYDSISQKVKVRTQWQYNKLREKATGAPTINYKKKNPSYVGATEY